jgi:hypothetical protein
MINSICEFLLLVESALSFCLPRVARQKNGHAGEVDAGRAMVYFVRWWREEGTLLSATSGCHAWGVGAAARPKYGSRTDLEGGVENSGKELGFLGQGDFLLRQAWGFDFQWKLMREDVVLEGHKSGGIDSDGGKGPMTLNGSAFMVQEKTERCIEEYIEKTDREEVEEKNISPTQVKKIIVLEEKERRKARWAARQRRLVPLRFTSSGRTIVCIYSMMSSVRCTLGSAARTSFHCMAQKNTLNEHITTRSLRSLEPTRNPDNPSHVHKHHHHQSHTDHLYLAHRHQ